MPDPTTPRPIHRAPVDLLAERTGIPVRTIHQMALVGGGPVVLSLDPSQPPRPLIRDILYHEGYGHHYEASPGRPTETDLVMLRDWWARHGHAPRARRAGRQARLPLECDPYQLRALDGLVDSEPRPATASRAALESAGIRPMMPGEAIRCHESPVIVDRSPDTGLPSVPVRGGILAEVGTSTWISATGDHGCDAAREAIRRAPTVDQALAEHHGDGRPGWILPTWWLVSVAALVVGLVIGSVLR